VSVKLEEEEEEETKARIKDSYNLVVGSLDTGLSN
jgi:hypothetical protein